jgi:hypothetical protein
MTGAVIGLLKIVAGWFGLSPFLAGAIAAGVAVTAIGGGLALYHHKVYQSGYDAALSDIAEENAETIARAVEKRNVWKDCRARDGSWDQSTGRCG